MTATIGLGKSGGGRRPTEVLSRGGRSASRPVGVYFPPGAGSRKNATARRDDRPRPKVADISRNSRHTRDDTQDRRRHRGLGRHRPRTGPPARPRSGDDGAGHGPEARSPGGAGRRAARGAVHVLDGDLADAEFRPGSGSMPRPPFPRAWTSSSTTPGSGITPSSPTADEAWRATLRSTWWP